MFKGLSRLTAGVNEILKLPSKLAQRSPISKAVTNALGITSTSNSNQKFNSLLGNIVGGLQNQKNQSSPLETLVSSALNIGRSVTKLVENMGKAVLNTSIGGSSSIIKNGSTVIKSFTQLVNNSKDMDAIDKTKHSLLIIQGSVNILTTGLALSGVISAGTTSIGAIATKAVAITLGSVIFILDNKDEFKTIFDEMGNSVSALGDLILGSKKQTVELQAVGNQLSNNLTESEYNLISDSLVDENVYSLNQSLINSQKVILLSKESLKELGNDGIQAIINQKDNSREISTTQEVNLLVDSMSAFGNHSEGISDSFNSSSTNYSNFLLTTSN